MAESARFALMSVPDNYLLHKDTPYALNLFFTGRCNLDCPYCFVNKENLEHLTVDEQSLKRSVDILFSYPGKRKTISFNGGEPTLEFALVKKIYDYAKKEAQKKKIILDVAVMTNGTVLNQEMVDYFARQKTIVKISIDGNKVSHDRNRPFKDFPNASSFDRIIANIDRINPGTLKLAATLVFTPKTIPHLIDNIKFLNQKGFHIIDFYPDLYAHWTAGELKAITKAFRVFESYYINLFKGKDKVFKNILLDDKFVNEIEVNKADYCGKIHLNPEGEFFACDKALFLDSKRQKEYVIGNIKRGVNDDKRAAILEALRQGFSAESGLKCSRCAVYKYCFCPVGHHIYAMDLKARHQKKKAKKFYQSFCFFSKIYSRTFLKIKSALRYNPRFIELYQF